MRTAARYLRHTTGGFGAQAGLFTVLQRGSDAEGRLPGFALSLGLFLAHACLGILLSKSSPLGLVYVQATVVGAVGVALWFREPYPVLYAVAYLVGAEVFWRMIHAGFFWELGKYAVVMTLLVGMARQRRLSSPVFPLLYFSLLIPGAIATLANLEWSTARRLVSANLSGPLTLLVCGAYCWSLRLRRSHVLALTFSMMVPLVAVAMRAAKGIATGDIDWATESNAAASGGFGPNQVSAMLGLGAFAALIYLVFSRRWWQWLLSGGLCLWFLSQSALTFSRTGVYLAALSSVVAGFFFLREPGKRLKYVGYCAVAGVIAILMIYPALEELTGGHLATRFSETQLSNRNKIAVADLEIWMENFLFGTGAGQAKYARAEYGFGGSAAHTEYTRMLAEHGLPGLMALAFLCAGVFKRFRRQPQSARALTSGLLTWGLAFMAVSAMRLAAPGFIIGLGFARWDLGGLRLRSRMRLPRVQNYRSQGPEREPARARLWKEYPTNRPIRMQGYR